MKKYRPEIDGLRAFAVVPIILFHLGYGWVAGGYLGVDVFFVISGFLITSIITDELRVGTFSFRNFWARRVRRILPVLIAVTSVTIACTWWFVFAGDWSFAGRQALAALFSVANLFFWQNAGDYWGSRAQGLVLLHTWSLSVEEQFYLFFPFVVWAVHRFRPTWLRGLFGATIVASLGVFLWGSLHHPIATFYLLPTRAWELATGALLSTLVRHPREPSPETHPEPDLPADDVWSVLSLLGLGLVLAGYLLLPGEGGVTSGLAIVVFGTAIVIASPGRGPCQWILSRPAVVYVGKISYSLYLWHWPVLVLASHLGLERHRVALMVVTALAAVASYHGIEQPTRRTPGIVPKIGLAFALAALLMASMTWLGPRYRYDLSAFATPSWHGLYYNLHPTKQGGSRLGEIIVGVDAPPRESPLDAYLNGGVLVGPGDTPRVVLLGDSHGATWAHEVTQVAERLGVRASLYTMLQEAPFVQLPLAEPQPDAPPERDWRRRYARSRLDWIARWRPDVVIVCARWSLWDSASMPGLLDLLEEHAGAVVLVEQTPETGIGDRSLLQYLAYHGVVPEGESRKYLPTSRGDELQASRDLVRTLAAQRTNFYVLPTYDLYADGDQTLVLDGDQTVYLDDDHLTDYGVHLAGGRLEELLAELMASAKKASAGD